MISFTKGFFLDSKLERKENSSIWIRRWLFKSSDLSLFTRFAAAMPVLIGSAAVDVALGRSSLGRPCSDIDMVMSSAELKQFIASARESNTLVTEESRHDGLKHSVVVSSESPLQSNSSFDIELAEMNDGSSSGSLLQMAIAAQQQKQDWVRVSLPQGVPVGDKEYSGLFAYVAPLLVLRAIKRAHLFAPVHWRKHIQDYHILKAATDSKPADASAIGVSAQELEDFQRLRFTEGVQRYGETTLPGGGWGFFCVAVFFLLPPSPLSLLHIFSDD